MFQRFRGQVLAPIMVFSTVARARGDEKPFPTR